MSRFLGLCLIIVTVMASSSVFAGQTLTFDGKVSIQIARWLAVPFPIYVDERLVDVGDTVHKGQRLVRYHLHPRELRAFQGELCTGGGLAEIQIQISALEQELIQRNAQSRTATELAAKGLTSQTDTLHNRRQLELLKQRKEALFQKKDAYAADFNLHMAELETYFGCKLQKGDTLPPELFLTAPIDATIVDISPRVRPLGLIDTGTPVITLAVLDPIQIQLQVYESEVSKLRIGQEVTVEVVNMGRKKVKGKIATLSWMPIDATIAVPSFYFVYVDIENSDHLIRPGYKVLVHIDVE